MNHPTPEDWMAHLYGEAPAARRAELDAHLHQCPSCARRVRAWRDGMGALDQWPLPASRRIHAWGPALRWAAAAAVVLVLGFLGGRFSAGNPRAFQAAMQRDFDARLALVRDELRAATAADTQRVLESFAQSLEEAREGDAATLAAALRQRDSRHSATFAQLRRDIDTVAVVAEGRLTDTQQQLQQLAFATRPENQTPPDHE